MNAVAAAARHRRAQPEYDAQVRLFVFLDWLGELHPSLTGELLDVWATSNGGKRPRGEAGRMKAAGQRKGVLDVECAVPFAIYHGLFIEMKSASGRLTPEQRDRIGRLRQRGYYCAVCRSWQAAGQVFCLWFKVPWPDHAEREVENRLAIRREVRRATRRQGHHWRTLPTNPYVHVHAGEPA